MRAIVGSRRTRASKRWTHTGTPLVTAAFGGTDSRSAMNDTHVTVIGNVVDSPRRYSSDGANP